MNNRKANLQITVEDCTIASGGATSGAINQLNQSLAGIIFPSTFDGTAITFTGSDVEGGTYVVVKGSDGNDISFTVAASRVLVLTEAQQAQLRGVPFLKIVAGTNQSTTDTVLKLLKRVCQ